MAFTPPKYVMVRLPRDLSQRVDEARPSTLSREAFVRRAVEAALGHDGEASGTGRATRPEASPAQTPSPKARREAGSQPAAPTPPRAPGEAEDGKGGPSFQTHGLSGKDFAGGHDGYVAWRSRRDRWRNDR